MVDIPTRFSEIGRNHNCVPKNKGDDTVSFKGSLYASFIGHDSRVFSTAEMSMDDSRDRFYDFDQSHLVTEHVKGKKLLF